MKKTNKSKCDKNIKKFLCSVTGEERGELSDDLLGSNINVCEGCYGAFNSIVMIFSCCDHVREVEVGLGMWRRRRRVI